MAVDSREMAIYVLKCAAWAGLCVVLALLSSACKRDGAMPADNAGDNKVAILQRSYLLEDGFMEYVYTSSRWDVLEECERTCAGSCVGRKDFGYHCAIACQADSDCPDGTYCPCGGAGCSGRPPPPLYFGYQPEVCVRKQ